MARYGQLYIRRPCCICKDALLLQRLQEGGVLQLEVDDIQQQSAAQHSRCSTALKRTEQNSLPPKHSTSTTTRQEQGTVRNMAQHNADSTAEAITAQLRPTKQPSAKQQQGTAAHSSA